MWYRIVLAYREVGRGGETTVHKTKVKYEKPTFVMDPSSSDPTMTLGTGSKVFGPGHYTSQNKLVQEGYNYPYTRVEKLPYGTRILNMDRIPAEHANRILKRLDPSIPEVDPTSKWNLSSLIAYFRQEKSVSESYIYYGGYGENLNFSKLYPILLELGYDAIEYSAGRNFSLDRGKINRRPREEAKKRGRKRFYKKFDKQIPLSLAELENYVFNAKMNYGANWLDSIKKLSTLPLYIDNLKDRGKITEEEAEKLMEINNEKKNVLVINASILIDPKLFQKERFRPETLSEEEKERLKKLKFATSYDVIKHIIEDAKKKSPEGFAFTVKDMNISASDMVRLKEENVISTEEFFILSGNKISLWEFESLLTTDYEYFAKNMELIVSMLEGNIPENALTKLYAEVQKHSGSADIAREFVNVLFQRGKIAHPVLKNILTFIKINAINKEDIVKNKFYDYTDFHLDDENQVSELHDIGFTVDEMKKMNWDSFHLYNTIDELLDMGFDQEFLINKVSNLHAPWNKRNAGFDFLEIIKHTDFEVTDGLLYAFIDDFLKSQDDELTYETKLLYVKTKMFMSIVKKKDFDGFHNRIRNFLYLAPKYGIDVSADIFFKTNEKLEAFNQLANSVPRDFLAKMEDDQYQNIVEQIPEEYDEKFQQINQIKEFFETIDDKFYGNLFCKGKANYFGTSYCGYIAMPLCPKCGSYNVELTSYMNAMQLPAFMKSLVPYYEMIDGDPGLSIYFEAITKYLRKKLDVILSNSYNNYEDRIRNKQWFADALDLSDFHELQKNPIIKKIFPIFNSYKMIFDLFEDPEFVKVNNQKRIEYGLDQPTQPTQEPVKLPDLSDDNLELELDDDED